MSNKKNKIKYKKLLINHGDITFLSNFQSDQAYFP